MAARVKNNMHRTNNQVKTWHRKLNCAFQYKHPTLWTFLDKLIKEENNVYWDMMNTTPDSQPPKRKNDSINQQLYNLVRNSHIDIKVHLKCIELLLSL